MIIAAWVREFGDPPATDRIVQRTELPFFGLVFGPGITFNPNYCQITDRIHRHALDIDCSAFMLCAQSDVRYFGVVFGVELAYDVPPAPVDEIYVTAFLIEGERSNAFVVFFDREQRQRDFPRPVPAGRLALLYATILD